MNTSPFNSFNFADKDLSNIPESKNYKCPKCGTSSKDEEYVVDGKTYPLYYNEWLTSDMDGTIHDWDEVHCCPNCKTVYKYRNGCF